MQANTNFKKYLVDLTVIALIFLFIYVAVSKLIDIQKFQVQLGQSPVLTYFSNWIAWIIPTLEIVTVILLISSYFRMLGLYFSFSLMILFTTYIIIITHFSEYIPCSCGGILQHMNWSQHLIFNLVFVILTGLSILEYPGKASQIILLQ